MAKIDLGLSNRQDILARSLIIESLASTFLSSLLGVKDYTNSKLFGNKGGCLSFNQKIDLLIEIDALSRDSRSKFQAFMEIRNQFVHNISATTYENCFSYTNGTDKFLLKVYPQTKGNSREEHLRNATMQLAEEIGQLIVGLNKKIEEKIRKEVEADISQKSQQAFLDAIEKIKTSLDEYFEKEISKSPTYNTKRLKGFGTGLSKILFQLWQKNFDAANAKK